MSVDANKMYGAVEAGGTKFVCAVGAGKEIIELCRVPTTSPEETFDKVIQFFQSHRHNLCGLGVASFGPVDLNPESKAYGFITSTPKPGWAQTDLLGTLRRELGLPLAFDTDVNGSAVGEAAYGAAQNLQDFIYITVGTGIGGGVITNSHLVHGLVHTELGHIFLPKHPLDSYIGHCPYHGDKCFEGLACGPAVSERWGIEASDLSTEHKAWEIQAWYLGAALSSIICAYSPQRIILGGGVMDVPGLLEKVHKQTLAHLNGYVKHPDIQENINNYVVKPGLGEHAGVIGALELIRRKLESQGSSV